MYLIILGADAVSRFLIKTALEEGHNVALIERDEERAQTALNAFDIAVFHGDIGSGNILEEAGAAKADALIATTDDDATNLMAMFLGSEHQIDTLISIVNEPDHRGMFERLGVEVLVDPEAIIARYLYKLLASHRLEETISLPEGETIFETTITEDSRLVNTTAGEARRRELIGEDMVIVLLKRDDERMINPGDDVTYRAGDRVIVFAQRPLDEREMAAFVGDGA